MYMTPLVFNGNFEHKPVVQMHVSFDWRTIRRRLQNKSAHFEYSIWM